jgi:hypothetical protein
LVIGEAEGSSVSSSRPGVGRPAGRLRGEVEVDVTTSPIPRFDLIDFSHYLYIGVQFSRIVRSIASSATSSVLTHAAHKTSAQRLPAQALHDAGYRGMDLSTTTNGKCER